MWNCDNAHYVDWCSITANVRHSSKEEQGSRRIVSTDRAEPARAIPIFRSKIDKRRTIRAYGDKRSAIRQWPVGKVEWAVVRSISPWVGRLDCAIQMNGAPVPFPVRRVLNSPPSYRRQNTSVCVPLTTIPDIMRIIDLMVEW